MISINKELNVDAEKYHMWYVKVVGNTCQNALIMCFWENGGWKKIVFSGCLDPPGFKKK